jgi:hypothetical protein
VVWAVFVLMFILTSPFCCVLRLYQAQDENPSVSPHPFR